MNLNNAIKERIRCEMRQRALKGKDLADATGMGTSWVSKLLKDMEDPHALKSLTDQQVKDIEKLLNIHLKVDTESGPMLGPVKELNALAEESPEVSRLVELLVGIISTSRNPTVPTVEEKDYERLGSELICIAKRFDHKPATVTEGVLKALQEFS